MTSLLPPRAADVPTALSLLPRVPPRVLAVVLGLEDVELTLPVAIELATEEERELCVAVLRPRPLWSSDAALCALWAERCDPECRDLLDRIRARTEEADLPTTIGVHMLTGLRGRRRREVLERTVGSLARHYDARPLGTWAA